MVAHSGILLSKCAQFRDEGQFIDVRLKVREDIFPAHRIVLAANSDYFHAMFTAGMKESNQEVIELKDESISADTLKIVMDSIYTGDLRVNEENVFELLAAADHLQVTSVVNALISGHPGGGGGDPGDIRRNSAGFADFCRQFLAQDRGIGPLLHYRVKIHGERPAGFVTSLPS